MIDELRSIVGPSHVLTDPSVTESYAVDWTGRFRGTTPAVVRPDPPRRWWRSCRRAHGTAWPSSLKAATPGSSPGGVPLAGEVVLSLRRLDASTLPRSTRCRAVDRRRGRDHRQRAGRRPRGRAGTTASTGRRGTRRRSAARSRRTREASACCATATPAPSCWGSRRSSPTDRVVSHLGGLVKDNTGYHLPSLVCGSEGTLAVVTAARLRLVPRRDERVVALLGFSTVDGALGRLRIAAPGAAITRSGRAVLCGRCRVGTRTAGAATPADRGRGLPARRVRGPGGPVVGAGGGGRDVDVWDAAVAIDPAQRAALWRYREDHTEAIDAVGPPTSST